MENGKVTAERLQELRGIDDRIQWCRDQLDHGYLIGEASVQEWATQAAGTVPREEYAAAMRAVERSRERIRNQLEEMTRERDTLLAWIDAIPKDDVRASIFLHFAKGYSYLTIAVQYFGNTITKDAVQKMCMRYIHGYHQGPVGRPKKDGETK